MSDIGRVVAAHGRQYVVEFPDGRRLVCVPRGKKSEVACGDQTLEPLDTLSPDRVADSAV